MLTCMRLAVIALRDISTARRCRTLWKKRRRSSRLIFGGYFKAPSVPSFACPHRSSLLPAIPFPWIFDTYVYSDLLPLHRCNTHTPTGAGYPRRTLNYLTPTTFLVSCFPLLVLSFPYVLFFPSALPTSGTSLLIILLPLCCPLLGLLIFDVIAQIHFVRRYKAIYSPHFTWPFRRQDIDSWRRYACQKPNAPGLPSNRCQIDVTDLYLCRLYHLKSQKLFSTGSWCACHETRFITYRTHQSISFSIF